MTLNKAEQSFIEFNKPMLENLINKKIADFNFASAHGATLEEREKMRLLVLEFESYLGLINDLLKKALPKKDFTGV